MTRDQPSSAARLSGNASLGTCQSASTSSAATTASGSMSSMASSNSAATAWLLNTATMPPRSPTARAVARVRQVLSAWTRTVGDPPSDSSRAIARLARGRHHLADRVHAERIDDGHVAGRAVGTLGELPREQLHVSFSFWSSVYRAVQPPSTTSACPVT